jgi:hypothetical protein
MRWRATAKSPPGSPLIDLNQSVALYAVTFSTETLAHVVPDAKERGPCN